MNTAFLRPRKKNNSSNREERYINGRVPFTTFLALWKGYSMKESAFQGDLIKRIKKEFPGCIVLKNDPNYIQGIPDLLVLYRDRWAALECKKSENAHKQPNQKYYILKMDKMSYARFVYPENEEEILNELQHALRVRRTSRLPISK